jgi:serpin B
MTYAGARGETAGQIEGALKLPRNNVHTLFGRLDAALNVAQASGSAELTIANSLWPQQDSPLRDDFIDLLRRNYHAATTPLDYTHQSEKARSAINDWVDENTRHKIHEIIGPGDISDLTRLVLANANYFKGVWATQFSESATHDGTFVVNSDKKVSVAFMSLSGHFDYFNNEFLECLILPYQGSRFEMVILLPSAGGWMDPAAQQVGKSGEGSLYGLERSLNATNFAGWTSASQNQEVDVSIPKFRVSGWYNLSSILRSLGVKDAFDFRRADFSGMDGNSHSLHLSMLLHQAVIEVNEKGTEAAASSAVTVFTLSAHQFFFANHPFVYLLREKSTGTILFMGRVADPESDSAPL